ncbi:hypothetical protein [Phyllobacterium lublinensis]|nr:hypothetical protein [Phyllobacterium sp. 2063]
MFEAGVIGFWTRDLQVTGLYRPNEILDDGSGATGDALHHIEP